MTSRPDLSKVKLKAPQSLDETYFEALESAKAVVDSFLMISASYYRNGSCDIEGHCNDLQVPIVTCPVSLLQCDEADIEKIVQFIFKHTNVLMRAYFVKKPHDHLYNGLYVCKDINLDYTKAILDSEASDHIRSLLQIRYQA